jgi:hypothetical protein
MIICNLFYNNLSSFKIQINKQMGNVCPCPKRRKEKELPYDVHEETFEIEESPQIGEQSPKNQQQDNENNILTE